MFQGLSSARDGNGVRGRSVLANGQDPTLQGKKSQHTCTVYDVR